MQPKNHDFYRSNRYLQAGRDDTWFRVSPELTQTNSTKVEFSKDRAARAKNGFGQNLLRSRHDQSSVAPANLDVLLKFCPWMISPHRPETVMATAIGGNISPVLKKVWWK